LTGGVELQKIVARVRLANEVEIRFTVFPPVASTGHARHFDHAATRVDAGRTSGRKRGRTRNGRLLSVPFMELVAQILDPKRFPAMKPITRFVPRLECPETFQTGFEVVFVRWLGLIMRR